MTEVLTVHCSVCVLVKKTRAEFQNFESVNDIIENLFDSSV